ncbi:MAG: hypothetical protein Q4A71_04470 [Actinomycetaceae bacterium]|nr:hypothetical protein [Actinomycetaceae bacterium]
MNVKDANYIISALNHVAELVTALAYDVEQQAWEGIEDHAGMSGARPIAAVQLAQPALEDAARQHQQAAAPAAEPEPQVTLEQIRGVLARLSGRGLTEQVRQMILNTGANKLSEVDPAKYPALLAEARRLSDA